MMSRLKDWWFSKRRLVHWLIALAAFLFLLGGIFLLLALTMGSRLPDQAASSRWAADGKRFAQMSVYFKEGEGITESRIDEFRFQIQKGMKEAMMADGKQGGKREWIDAYSREDDLTVSRGNVSDEVTAIGCGGDFFLFHPVLLLNGAYFSENDVMHDRVLLEEETAWQLFGSSDVSGMAVNIQDSELLVAGVFSLDNNQTLQKAKKGQPVMFLPFDTLNALTGSTSGGENGGGGSGNPGGNQANPVAGDGSASGDGGISYRGGIGSGGASSQDKNAGITCYELVVPNPVSGFAKNLTVKAVSGLDMAADEEPEEKLGKLSMVFVENSNRFSVPELLETLKKTGMKSMKQEEPFYPYWENEATAVQDYCAILLGTAGILLIPYLLLFSILLGRRYRRRKWTFGYFRIKIEAVIEKRRKKIWEEKKKKGDGQQKKQEKTPHRRRSGNHLSGK